jgi:hypothetical protein
LQKWRIVNTKKSPALLLWAIIIIPTTRSKVLRRRTIFNNLDPRALFINITSRHLHNLNILTDIRLHTD